MTKSATEVMEDVLFAAVLDAIAALKANAQGMPNALLREINAIHANSARADLPKELQAAISASVRTSFTRLMKEGYSVAPAGSERRAPPPRPQGQRPGPGGPRPPGNRPGGAPRRGPKPDRAPRRPPR